MNPVYAVRVLSRVLGSILVKRARNIPPLQHASQQVEEENIAKITPIASAGM